METRTPEMLTDVQRSEMVNQMKEYLGIETHAEFARKLGITTQNAHAWVQRGTFNAELIATTFPEFSGDWLLTGKGPMLKADRVQARPSVVPTGVNTDYWTEKTVDSLVASLKTEQKIAEHAQEQMDRLIAILRDMTEAVKNLQKMGGKTQQ